MLKKRMMILGLAGVLATGFGVAGCSGDSNSVAEMTENASLSEAESVSRATNSIASEESSTDEVTVTTEALQGSGSTGANTTTVASSDAQYEHLICDGNVSVKLSTNIEQYLTMDDSGYAVFEMVSLAKDLGWKPARQVSDDYIFGYDYGDGKVVRFSMEIPYSTPIKEGASGANMISLFRVWNTAPTEERWTTAEVKQLKPDLAIYLTPNKKNSLSYDQVVLSVYIMEHRNDLASGKLDIFSEILSGYLQEQENDTIVYKI